jgi:hypothetical protein
MVSKAKSAAKVKSDEPAETGPEEFTLPEVGAVVRRLARSHGRSSLILLVLLIAVGAVSAGQIVMLNTRLSEFESGLGTRTGRASDDFARIQDQTAAMRAGVELLHRDLTQVRGQLDQITRELRRQSDE